MPRSTRSRRLLGRNSRERLDAIAVALVEPEFLDDADALGQRLAVETGERLTQIAGREAERFHQRLHRNRVDRRIGEMQQRQEAEIGVLELFRLRIARPRFRDRRQFGRREVASHVGGAMAAEAHGRHHQPEIGAVAAHNRHIRLAGQHLRDLADAGGRFLMDDVVRMLEDAQQVVPVQVALHPRRVVVDAERQVGGVGDVEEKSLDIVLGRADIGGGGQDGAVGAIVFGEPHIVDRCLGVVAGAAEEDRHAAGLHFRGLDDDLFLFFRREHGSLAGRAHDQDRGGAVVGLKFQQRSERLEIDRAVLVERRDQGDERTGEFLARISNLQISPMIPWFDPANTRDIVMAEQEPNR